MPRYKVSKPLFFSQQEEDRRWSWSGKKREAWYIR